MFPFFAVRGDQDSESASTNVHDSEHESSTDSEPEYESTSDVSQEPELDEKGNTKEDNLKLEKKMPASMTGNTKAKVKKKSWSQTAWGRKSKQKWNGTYDFASMHMAHHHSTFSHLVHDALLRLKCSPIHRYGYSYKQILKNIERYYRLRLGQEFKFRLQLTLEKLVEKTFLIHVESNKDQNYKPSVAFLKTFAKVKVIDQAENLQFAVEIYRPRSRRGHSTRHRSSSRSRFASRKRGLRRRRMSKRRRISRRRGSKKGVKHQRHGQSYHRQWSKSKQHAGKSQSIKSEALNDAQNDERKTDSKLAVLRKLKRSYESHKRKRSRGSSSRAKGMRYRRFQLVRIREHEENPASPVPKGSLHQSEGDSHSESTEVSEGSQCHIDDLHHEYSHSHSHSKALSDANANKVRTTVANRSRKEHDILHAIKDSSEIRSPRKSFLQRVGDTFRNTFGSEQTSIKTCVQGIPTPQALARTPSRSQRLLRSAPENLRRSCANSNMVATLKCNRECSICPRDPTIPISQRLANLLQE